MKKISLIAAMSRNRAIGLNNKLPWHLPADLAHFKSLTVNNTVIMGRNTYDSIGKPLPKRQNIIITSHPETVTLPITEEKNAATNSLDNAINLAKHDIFIIGGGQLYQAAFAKAQTLYLTIIDADIIGDCYFPEFNLAEWNLVQEEAHTIDEKNRYPYRFLTYVRKRLSC